MSYTNTACARSKYVVEQWHFASIANAQAIRGTTYSVTPQYAATHYVEKSPDGWRTSTVRSWKEWLLEHKLSYDDKCEGQIEILTETRRRIKARQHASSHRPHHFRTRRISMSTGIRWQRLMGRPQLQLLHLSKKNRHHTVSKPT